MQVVGTVTIKTHGVAPPIIEKPNFENPFDGLQKNFNKFFPGGGKVKEVYSFLS